MTDHDQKGILASVALANVIDHVVACPGEPVPMEQLRDAVVTQAEFTIAHAAATINIIYAKLLAEHIELPHDPPEPDPKPDPN